MHKKLEAELISLAHQILQLKDKKDVAKLKNLAQKIHEKLSLLSFMDEYFITTPNVSEDKEVLLEKFANRIESKIEAPKLEAKVIVETPKSVKEVKETKVEVKKEEVVKTLEIKKKEPITEVPVIENTIELDEKVETQTKSTLVSEAARIANKINAQKEKPSLANNEEFKDAIPADVQANLFEKAPKKQEVVKPIETPKAIIETPAPAPVSVSQNTEVKTSLNDKLLNQKIQIGLNDRIAFVKHLFNYSQEEFNRVLSQLNTFTSEKESKDFINLQVKPDYNWSVKEEYEARLMSLIERRFL
jgi:hypothetical protein